MNRHTARLASRTTLFVATLSLGASAWASDVTSPRPPAPPVVSLDGLPAEATVQRTEPDGSLHPVRAHLILDRTAAAPGETVRAGILLEQTPGWHTYWKYNADIGLPTDISWSLPDGFMPSDYAYPVPQRFDDSGLVSFGYEQQTFYFSEITLPLDVQPGTVDLSASASWLVCKSSCIPGEVTLHHPLTIGPAGEPSSYATLFDHYQAQHPAKLDALPLTVDAELNVDHVLPNSSFKARFTVKPTEGGIAVPPMDVHGPWPSFTPIAGADWMIDKLTVTPSGESLVVLLEGTTFAPDALPAADQVGGLFQVQLGDQTLRFEHTIPLPWAADGAAQVVSADPSWAAPAAAAPLSEATPAVVAQAAPPAVTGEPAPEKLGLLANLFLGVIGGLLLNIMPCVLPVLTLKLYGLVEQADISPRARRGAGLAYSAGILASFLALGAVIIILRNAFGMQVGWGFQFQYPPYIAGLATLVFAFGLSLFGVFEVPAFGVATAHEAGQKEGLGGYFATGVFATLVATPCSAPFLGTAIAFAFSEPAAVMLAIFSAVALGLALPFLLIAFIPGLFRFLPRPGPWMETFKQFMGFTLIATAVWLVSVLMVQIGPDRTVSFLAFLLVVAFAAWGYGRFAGLAAAPIRQLLGALGALAVIEAGVYYLVDMTFFEPPVCEAQPGEQSGLVPNEQASLDYSEEIPWQPFSEATVASFAGKPIFIDFTAVWCLSCKVTEATQIETEAVRKSMAELGVIPIKADWSRKDPTISEWLARYQKAAVPFYLVIQADGQAVPLGEIVTSSQLIAAFEAAR